MFHQDSKMPQNITVLGILTIEIGLLELIIFVRKSPLNRKTAKTLVRLVTISVHLAAAIVSLYNTIPPALAASAFVVAFIFAVAEAGAAFIWRRGFEIRRDSGI